MATSLCGSIDLRMILILIAGTGTFITITGLSKWL